MKSSQGKGSTPANDRKFLLPLLICLVLAALTVAVYWQIKDSGFIKLDDNLFVYQNAYVQSGLNWNSIRQAFSTELLERAGWVPLTWLSLMLDTEILGFHPSSYHLTNLLLHVINTILLFLILRRMTKTLWSSAFVAALFAIHPLHVESVAWIAERRDVLSTFFMMLTLGAYGYYVEQRNLKLYAFVLLFFILGLMAKPMLVTLPFVLLLLDFWPLERFGEIKPVQKMQTEVLKPEITGKPKKKSGKKGDLKEIPEFRKTMEIQKPGETEYKWSLIYPLLLEKLPLFVITIVLSFATFVAAQSEGYIADVIPLGTRIGNAFISYISYIGKMLWPFNLAVFYPYPGRVIPWQVFGSIFLLSGITLAVIWRAKRFPYLSTGWFWYVGTLAPVIGVVQLGAQAMADRYTYIPLIGLFIMVAWGVPELLKKVHYRKEILWAVSVLCILCLSVITWKQVGHWRSSLTLFDHTLSVTDNNWLAYDGRCAANNEAGNYRQAIEDCDKALQLKQLYVTAYNGRGNAYSALGNYKQAVEDYSRAIEIKQDYADAYYNRGIAYAALGNYKQAIEDYSRAIKITPGHTDAYNDRGAAYYILGNYNQAIEDFSRAIKINPNFTGAYFNRGVAYVRSGNRDMAINDLVAAARLGDERAKNFLKINKISW